MNYPCVEKTVEIKHGETVIRLWIDITKGDTVDVQKIIRDIRETAIKLKAYPLIINYLKGIVPNLNAVQIFEENELKNEKIGTVAYLVPFEDIKG